MVVPTATIDWQEALEWRRTSRSQQRELVGRDLPRTQHPFIISISRLLTNRAYDSARNTKMVMLRGKEDDDE
jgi:hypothetical protein